MEKEEKILIVEDDQNIANVLEIHVKDLGYKLDWAMDGKTGLQKALENDYRLIILDIMLPRMDGIEVCKQIRDSNKYTPILMLTAKSEELDKVLGLEIGADDYITKPFSIREVIARIKAILRRVSVDTEKHQDELDKNILEYGEMTIDMEKHKVMISGNPVELTAKEFDLLSLLAKNPGRIYRRQDLLELIWGYQYSGYDHTVNSHINRLRNKIEKDPSNPQYIKTLWGIGYRFTEMEEVTK